MGRSPCCNVDGVRKGAWTEDEDRKLSAYIAKHGEGGWRSLPQQAGLLRCGKSCRLRWANYLKPGIKRGEFSQEEEQIIIRLHASLGNKWSSIAKYLPRRTDNEIKNHWNTRLKKRVAVEAQAQAEHEAPKTREFKTPRSLSSKLLNEVASKLNNSGPVTAELVSQRIGESSPKLSDGVCTTSGSSNTDDSSSFAAAAESSHRRSGSAAARLLNRMAARLSLTNRCRSLQNLVASPPMTVLPCDSSDQDSANRADSVQSPFPFTETQGLEVDRDQTLLLAREMELSMENDVMLCEFKSSNDCNNNSSDCIIYFDELFHM